MADYLMTTQVTLESGGGAANQVVFVAPVAITQGQSLLTGVDNLAFYDGNLLAFFRYWWKAESKILVNKIRLSIPQYRGASYSPDRSVTKFRSAVFETISETTGTIVEHYFNSSDYGEWTDLNLLLSSPDAGERFYLNWPQNILWADFRNVQTIYDGIYPKLLIELLVTSPYQPELT